MNDRFRFRAYNKELKKMYEVDTICPYEDNHTKGGEVFLKGIQYNSFYFPEEVEVMQCTGLKDKNGELIYEGDIVKFRNTDNKYYIGTIKYTDEDALFCLSYRNENNRDDWDYVSRYKLEVIGNIYENKKLLQGRTVQN